MTSIMTTMKTPLQTHCAIWLQLLLMAGVVSAAPSGIAASEDQTLSTRAECHQSMRPGRIAR